MSEKRICRAKFVCYSEERNTYSVGQRTYKFSAITPLDGEVPENERFHKYTPAGNLSITVDNPDVEYKLGQSYYLDFVEAAE